MEQQFLNPDLTQDQITELSNKMQDIIDDIEEKELRWLELAEKMENE